METFSTCEPLWTFPVLEYLLPSPVWPGFSRVVGGRDGAPFLDLPLTATRHPGSTHPGVGAPPPEACPEVEQARPACRGAIVTGTVDESGVQVACVTDGHGFGWSTVILGGR